MDFFTCGSCSHLPNDLATAEPALTESSCSDPSEAPSLSESLAAGTTAPSTLLGRRKLSTALTSKSDLKHPTLSGRPVINIANMRPWNRQPQAPTSAPFHIPEELMKVTKLQDRVATSPVSKTQRAVAPLPVGGATGGDVHKPSFHRASSAPITKDISRTFRVHPPPLRLDAWSEPNAENYQVRGPTYMQDKVKVFSEQAAFRLLTVDLVQCDKPILTGLCAHPDERVQQALRREQETGVKELPEFIFAINLCVPAAKTYHHVSYFAVDNLEEIQHPTTPFGRIMNQFIFGDSDEFRRKTFKLIPRIVQGNFVVKKAVGSKPSILGRKIQHYYIRGPNYFEVVVDIASCAIAQKIVKLSLGYAKTLTVDMMFLLEGAHEALLPEQILGGIRMKNIDFKDKDGKRRVECP